MEIKIYQVDAFADKVFSGNPAAVCPLEEWLPDHIMQSIAMENNLSETAFIVEAGEFYEIRWFTPTVEVDLCGHATLASAYVLYTQLGYNKKELTFKTKNVGDLSVRKQGNWFELDFPADEIMAIELTEEHMRVTDQTPRAAFRGRDDIMLIFDDIESIRNMQPNLGEIAKLEARGLIVTAAGKECDFVSRFFGPQSGVDEDPVTGSAHTTLTPYWATVYGRNSLVARQLSVREGLVKCNLVQDRVVLEGQAILYMKGLITLD